MEAALNTKAVAVLAAIVLRHQPAPDGAAPSIDAGRAPPGKEEGPALWGCRAEVQCPKKPLESDETECDASLSEGDSHFHVTASNTEKRYSTLAARLCLAGWALTRGQSTEGAIKYSATRWGHNAASMGTLDEVADFAHRVGAPS